MPCEVATSIIFNLSLCFSPQRATPGTVSVKFSTQLQLATYTRKFAGNHRPLISPPFPLFSRPSFPLQLPLPPPRIPCLTYPSLRPLPSLEASRLSSPSSLPSPILPHPQLPPYHYIQAGGKPESSVQYLTATRRHENTDAGDDGGYPRLRGPRPGEGRQVLRRVLLQGPRQSVSDLVD